MSLYDMTCFNNGGVFEMFNCVNSASNFVLLNILLIVLFLVTTAVFLGSAKSVKNVMLLSSVVTVVASLVMLLAAGASSVSASDILGYSGTTFVWFVILMAALLYHSLSDL